MQHRLLHLRVRRARGQRKGPQVLGRVVPFAAAPSWVVGYINASTHRYLSFELKTEHIVSEMRLILRSDKGKAGVLYRACLDLPSAALSCPLLPSRPPTPEWRCMPRPEAKPIRTPARPCLRALA
jgi:hypothetical protein